jgi:dihydrofolate reductase
MGKLIYSMNMSLDGYINDANGGFDWTDPEEEAFVFITEHIRPVGTYLYGRRVHELMSFWETAHLAPDASPAWLDFCQVWQAADKVVYSTTLREVTTARTRLERSFDVDAVRRLKGTSDRDLTIEGPTLAGYALRAGLVDEIAPYVAPIAVGGGTRFLPDGLMLELDLLEERRMGTRGAFLRYRVVNSSG